MGTSPETPLDNGTGRVRECPTDTHVSTDPKVSTSEELSFYPHSFSCLHPIRLVLERLFQVCTISFSTSTVDRSRDIWVPFEGLSGRLPSGRVGTQTL